MFCKGAHKVNKCNVVTDPKERLAIVKRDGVFQLSWSTQGIMNKCNVVIDPKERLAIVK